MNEGKIKVLTGEPGRVSLLTGSKGVKDMVVFLMYRKLKKEIRKESGQEIASGDGQ